jgi:hypothetical protein
MINQHGNLVIQILMQQKRVLVGEEVAAIKILDVF